MAGRRETLGTRLLWMINSDSARRVMCCVLGQDTLLDLTMTLSTQDYMGTSEQYYECQVTKMLGRGEGGNL